MYEQNRHKRSNSHNMGIAVILVSQSQNKQIFNKKSPIKLKTRKGLLANSYELSKNCFFFNANFIGLILRLMLEYVNEC